MSKKKSLWVWEKFLEKMFNHVGQVATGEIRTIRDDQGNYLRQERVLAETEHFGFKEKCKKCKARGYDIRDFENCFSTLGSVVALGDFTIIAIIIFVLVRVVN